VRVRACVRVRVPLEKYGCLIPTRSCMITMITTGYLTETGEYVILSNRYGHHI